jgi:hypothetical protein
MGFDAQAEANALAEVAAKQANALAEVAAKRAAQYKPAPRKFASVTVCFGRLYAVATDGTAWAYQTGKWIQLDNLPATE